MGKSVFILPNPNGMFQLLGKGKEGSVHIAGIRDKGMTFFAICKAADIIPDSRISLRQVGGSHGIQKHHPTAVEVCTKSLLQHSDGFRQFFFTIIAFSLNRGFDSH